MTPAGRHAHTAGARSRDWLWWTSISGGGRGLAVNQSINQSVGWLAADVCDIFIAYTAPPARWPPYIDVCVARVTHLTSNQYRFYSF